MGDAYKARQEQLETSRENYFEFGREEVRRLLQAEVEKGTVKPFSKEYYQLERDIDADIRRQYGVPPV
jgi:hypothetical protein